MSHLRRSVLARNVRRTCYVGDKLELAPIKWDQYFESEEKVITEKGTFHVYRRGKTGPVIACLHGGGYSALTWAIFAVEISDLVECQVVAIDLRGHGNTVTKDDTDLSLQTMAQDVLDVLQKMFAGSEPPVVLIGHSMGGAVAVECALMHPPTVALCVIDVVEGTALDALSSMQSILRGRPTQFASLQHAIQWCYKGGQTHNLEAARVSMPGQVVNAGTGVLGANECDSLANTDHPTPVQERLSKDVPAGDVLEEVDEDDDGDEGAAAASTSCAGSSKPPIPQSSLSDFALPSPLRDGPKYTWRIDLSKTEAFWSGWFSGLSTKFLESRPPKLLILANINGLDTALTVGQMQGKFQLQVLAKSGHAIHEDQPNHVADLIGLFLVKQKLVVAKVDFTSPMPAC